MCGYIGKISFNTFDVDSLNDPNDLIICRGPDSLKSNNGTLFKHSNQLEPLHYSVIFNRLSIIDLNENANQPMHSEKYKTQILFNGEIYNHSELREELEAEGLKFSTSHSDTEVLLLGLSHHGLDFIDKIVGQFAIVFIDEEKQTINLIRDRLGQKPLFYRFTEDSFIFSSNLKSIVLLENNYNIDNDSLIEYLNIGVVTSPNTIFKDIYKLKPAEIISITIKDKKFIKNSKIYWSLEGYVGNKQFKKNEFFEILKKSIKMRNISDVPVAHFLSGGIDSTSLVKIQKNSVNTFSIGYRDDKYDESKFFNQVAEKYETNHTFKNIENKFSIQDVENSISAFDEPYSDPSTVPSYFISKEMALQYKVAISGDGGDELLGGYDRTVKSINEKNIAQNFISKLFKFYPAVLGTGNKLLSNARDLPTSYSSYLSDNKFLNLLGIQTKQNQLNKYFLEGVDRYKAIQIAEYKLYLTEMMMLKIDRTSMINSLEVRSPFVDHNLIEYVLSTDYKYINVENPKEIMKDFLSDDFDKSFLFRKKMGFVFDIKGWIYSNIEYIDKVYEEGVLKEYYSTDSIKKLYRFKTRVNALMLWKIYFLEVYFSNLDNLLND